MTYHHSKCNGHDLTHPSFSLSSSHPAPRVAPSPSSGLSACLSSPLPASIYPGPSVVLTRSDPNTSGLLSSPSALAPALSALHKASASLSLTPYPWRCSPSVRTAKSSSLSAGSRSKAPGTSHSPWVLLSPHPNTEGVSTFVQPSSTSRSLKPRCHSLPALPPALPSSGALEAAPAPALSSLPFLLYTVT